MKYTYLFNGNVVVMTLNDRTSASIECQDPENHLMVQDIVFRDWSIVNDDARHLITTRDIDGSVQRITRLFPRTCTNEETRQVLIYTLGLPTRIFECTGENSDLTQFTELPGDAATLDRLNVVMDSIVSGWFNETNDLYFAESSDLPLRSLSSILYKHGQDGAVHYLTEVIDEFSVTVV